MLQLNNLEAAIEDCNKAVELDPDYLKAYMRRAKWYNGRYILFAGLNVKYVVYWKQSLFLKALTKFFPIDLFYSAIDFACLKFNLL